MIEEVLSNERLLQVLLVGGFVLGVAIMSTRRQIAGMAAEGLPQQHPLLRAIETAAAIGIGAVWTALIYTGPSLTEVWHGQGRVLHWTSVLLCTALWLAYRPPAVPKDPSALWTTILVRVVLYGVAFALAIFSLNDW